MPDMFQDFIGQDDAIRPLAGERNLTHNENASEILFMHASEDFIEKNLGEDESMIVHKESLAAFSDCVTIGPVGDGEGWNPI